MPLFLFIELKLFQLLGHVGSVLPGTDLVVDVCDLPIFADVDRDATRESTRTEHTKCFCIFFLWVTQDGIVQFQRLGERLVSFGRIYTGSKVGDVKFTDSFAILTE